MKSTGKHRAASAAPRTGAAALMIGGLVAGTVATAGAAALTQETSTESATAADTTSTASSTADSPLASQAKALASLRSASLGELRDQSAADRSEARSAPADAASVATVLSGSTFTGETVVVEEEVVEEAAAESTEQAATATATEQAATQTQQQAAPARQQQAAPATQTQAPATTTSSAPAQSAPAQSAPAPIAGGVVGIAQQYVGYGYTLPGNPPSTFDCSSFTWWVYKQAGINIPMTVAGQKAAVTPVSNPQPGDLVFTNQFYHVGIYAGNGMVIEALNASSGVTYGAPVYGGVWYGRITG